MKQVIFGGYYNALNAVTTEYNQLYGGFNWTYRATRNNAVVATSGKIKNLRVKLSGAPGAGTHYDFTLMLNNAPTALTVEIANTATSGADTTHEVDVVAGDLVQLRCEPTNTPATPYATWTSIFEGTTPRESLIMGGTGAGYLSNTATEYMQPMAGKSPGLTEDDRRTVCPTSGKIKNLYVELEDSPGTAPDAYKFTLRKNGVSQTLTVTITAPDTTGNNIVNEVTVAAGDVLTLMIEPLETPATGPRAWWGMIFVADTDGESIILAGTAGTIVTTNVTYIWLTVCWEYWSYTESKRYQLGQSCTLKKLYVLLSAAPGAGKSYTFTVRKPGNGQADGNLTVTIANAATTGNDVAHEDTIADDDYVDLKCTPAGTPDVVAAYWGVVGYIGPPPAVGRSYGYIIG